jgi:hypothetical protein
MGAQLGRARTGNCLAAGFGVGVATVPVGEAPVGSKNGHHP